MRYALAMECVHTYSLVHDDLPAMDDDDLRRGRPTVHVAFDEATAVLVGDGLQSLAFAHLLAAPEPGAGELARLLADNALLMVEGQQRDIEAEHRALDEAGVLELMRTKTGALLAASIAGGARCAGADAAAVYPVGLKLGLAFQIADDLLDLTADTATLGKRAGKDAAAGKATLPVAGRPGRGPGPRRGAAGRGPRRPLPARPARRGAARAGPLRHRPEEVKEETIMGRLLDAIDSPADLKKLPVGDLPRLCAEIREEIIETCAANGGHLGSSLGAVELNVALHYVFSSPTDKLVWDVGHQAYAHKLLTGRRDRFRTIRTEGGLAGFPERHESEHDAFGVGHASTADLGGARHDRGQAPPRRAGQGGGACSATAP